MKYVYPRLSNRDYGFFRIGGPGLANCLFFAARAHLRAKQLGCEMLRPTWERIGIGQWLRHEKDKRFYQGLFRDESVWMKLRKAWLIRFAKDVVVEKDLAPYFEDIFDDREEIVRWLMGEILPEAIATVPKEMKDSVAVHIRLGDFGPPCSTTISWYVGMIKTMLEKVGRSLDIQIFSDGTDGQLEEVLSMPGARRVFYGNALADIIAISRCGLLIASDSTFSGWGAYLGNLPCVFPHLHSTKGHGILKDPHRFVVSGVADFPEGLVKYLSKH